jgi:hypothetical protein
MKGSYMEDPFDKTANIQLYANNDNTYNATSNNDLAKVANDYIVRERSNYQLRHFVIGQHDTPEMRYRQILLEAKDLIFKIKNAELSLEITKRKIEKLEASDKETDHLKAQQKRLGMSLTLEALEGARRELSYLAELSKEYAYYSPEEIEENQEEYWQKRLTRQAATDRLSLEQGVHTSNLTSMMNAGLVNKEIGQ